MRTAAKPDAQQPSRIVVTNFDTIRQATLWVTLGAEAATDRLIAMLRAAVLVGGQVVLDRNQILDGVFFLALGPDGIAAALGLEPRDTLPLLMTCAPGGIPDVPAQLGQEGDDLRVSLASQRTGVRTDQFLAKSSALSAMAGQSPEYAWLLPKPGPAWYAAAGFTDRFHSTRDRGAHQRLRAAAQERWLDAAAHARLAVVPWQAGFDMQAACAAQLRHIEEVSGEALNPLAREVLGLTCTNRGDMLKHLAERGGTRAMSDARLRSAAQLWSRAYYRAIADNEGTQLIAFDEAQADEAYGDGDEATLAREFGLVSKPISRLQAWLERHRPGPTREFRVDGEILAPLEMMDSGTFRTLARTSGDAVAAISAGERESLRDLALACRVATATPPTRRARRRTLVIRVLFFAALAAAVTCLPYWGTDSTLVRGLITGLTIILGICSAIPWDDLAEARMLSDHALSATLDVRPSS